MKNEEKIIKFVKNNTDKTPDEIKKLLRAKFREQKFYNEDVEEYIIKLMSKKKSKLKSKDDNWER